MIPRPARNNNPGDLEAGDHWQGLMPSERLTDIQKHERFAVFQDPEHGFRALVVLLRNYKVLYGADTVRKIINRFAPPTENPTDAYAKMVAHGVGVGPDDHIDVTAPKTMFAVAKGIAIDETGSWEPYWNDAMLHKGMALAGMEAVIA